MIRRSSSLLIPLFILWGLTVAAYSPSLSGSWVLDDPNYIVGNPVLRKASQWHRFFTDPNALTADANQARMMYRPLTGLSFAINHALGGQNPFWYHLASVSLHGINVVLVFLLCLYLLGPDAWIPAWAGALFFAVHPANVEAVAYISGSRATLLSLFFSAGAVLLYADKRRSPRPRLRSALALTAFACALLSKESSVFILVLIPAHDFLFRERETLRERWRRWWPYLAVFAVFLLCRRLALGQWAQRGLWGGTLWTHVLFSIQGLFRDVQIGFWPTKLRACYSFPSGPGLILGSLWKGAALISFGWITYYLVRLRSSAGLGLLWFGAALLPVSNLLPIDALAADRFLYAPTVGLALVWGWWIKRIILRTDVFDPRSRRRTLEFAKLAPILLSTVMLVLTLEKQKAWQDNFSLDLAAHSVAPEDPCTGLNLSTHYFNWGMYENAYRLSRPAREENSPLHLKGHAFSIAGLSRLRSGRAEDAIPYLEAARTLRPGDQQIVMFLKLARQQASAR